MVWAASGVAGRPGRYRARPFALTSDTDRLASDSDVAATAAGLTAKRKTAARGAAAFCARTRFLRGAGRARQECECL